MWQIRAGHAIDEIKIDGTPEVWQSATLFQLENQLKVELASGRLFLLDPTLQLCDAHSCYVVRDGVVNFRDISHLPELAARKMEPDFHKALDWAKQSE
jgi:hypothetical protein